MIEDCLSIIASFIYEVAFKIIPLLYIFWKVHRYILFLILLAEIWGSNIKIVFTGQQDKESERERERERERKREKNSCD